MKTRFTFCLIFVLYLSLVSTSLHATEWVPLKSNSVAASEAEILRSDINTSEIKLSLAGFFRQTVQTQDGISEIISTPGSSPILEAGSPDLPHFTVSLLIPDKGNSEIKIISSTYLEYSGINIAPSKGNLKRNINPSDIPFRKGSVYHQDNFWPAQLVKENEPYILRDYRGQSIHIKPFSYNPVTKILRVYTEIIFSVNNIPSQGINELIRNQPLRSVSSDFHEIYASHFKNFNYLTYIPIQEPGKLLILCPSQWLSVMQPFVDWKIQKGIPTEIIDVSNAGLTAQDIRSFIASYYNTNGLTYLLLVGDVADIPTLSAYGGASDPGYGYILGNDSYSEVIVGRFSAESNEDVNTQVQRVIHYEKTPDPNASFLDKAVVIGSNQGPGDDGEMDWEHAANMRTDLLGFTYTSVAELYDGTHPGTTDNPGDPDHIELFNLFQSGIGAMTYTGHGSNTACSTTGLENSDVTNMTNINMLPFIWSVACVNGNFNMSGGPCFAEAFMRARYNSQPTGAISTFMSSINQSWSPPMEAQDEMVDLLAGLSSSLSIRTFGGLSVNGCLKMNDTYTASGYEMTETWHIFGDPTLNVRTSTPQVMTVNHLNTLPVGTSSLLVNSSLNGSFVSLTVNGQIIASGVVSNGTLLCNFSALNTLDTLFVTVTGFNQMPYLGHVLIIPASGPYVIYQSNIINDVQGNNDGLADFDETINVDLTLYNAGMADANNVTATLSTADPYITVTNASTAYPSVLSNSSASINSAFTYTISDNIPDQHAVVFNLDITDGINTWNSTFTQIINAPDLEAGILTVNDNTGGDGDGIAEAGETVDLIINCLNIGHSDAPLAVSSITSSSPYITILTANANPGTILKQSSTDVVFTISVDPNITIGTAFDISFTLASGTYSTQHLYYEQAGEILEDFETNDFSRFNWQMGGNADWITTSAAPFQGLYSAKSDDITDNESSELLITVNSLIDDSVSFYMKVSSEDGWDYLRFYIDGIQKGQWSGVMPWSYKSFPVEQGTHVLRFSYEKDAIISENDDCAWLDNISLPPGTVITSVESITGSNNGLIYPNPTSGISIFKFNSKKQGVVNMHLMDINGKLIDIKEYNVYAGENYLEIDFQKLSSGLYFVKCYMDTETSVYKLNIQK